MRRSNCCLLLIYLPRKDERLSRPGWMTYSGRFTHISGHPSAAGRAQDRESSPIKDRRSTNCATQPTMDRAALWKALRSSGAPLFLIQLIEHLHTGTTSRVRVGGQLSEPFETTSGVRQGCVLAPALFYPAVQVPRAPQSVPRNSRTTIMLMMPCYSLTVLLSGRTYCQASMKLHIRWV